jgi:hypothetical protein
MLNSEDGRGFILSNLTGLSNLWQVAEPGMLGAEGRI